MGALLAVTPAHAQLVVNITSPTDGATLVTSVTNAINISVTASSTSSITNLTLNGNGLVLRRFTLPAGQTNVTAQMPVFLPSQASYTFTVDAADTSGATASSSAVTVTISFATAPTPPTNTMVLWLAADTGVITDSDGQSITNWTDMSGRGNDARPPSLANAPYLRNAVSLGGAYVARFNVLDSGVSRYMLITNSPSIAACTTNFTFLTIAQEFDGGANYALLSETTGAYNPNPFRWHWNGGGAIGLDLGAGGSPTVVNNSSVSAGAAFGILGARAGNNTIVQSINFTNTTPTTIGSAAVANANIGWNLGQGDSLFHGFYGNMAELLCYSNRLSDSDYLMAQSYLAYKYEPELVFLQVATATPTAIINSPTNGATFDTVLNGNITFSVSASGTNPIFRIAYLVNGVQVGVTNVTGQSPPYLFTTQVLQPGTFTLTAVATDILGLTGTSPGVVVTVTGPSLAPPSSGLAVWLKPDAGMLTNGNGTIAEWDDQSGKTNNALQPVSVNAPVRVNNSVNGYAAAYFDQITNGSPQYLDIASATTIQKTSFSMFTVARAKNQSGNYDILSKTATNATAPSPFDWRFVPGGSSEMDVGAGASATAVNVSSFVPSTSTFNIIGAVVGGGFIKQYLGNSPGTITTLGSAAIADGGTPMRVGNRGALDATMYGSIAEILYYDHAVTDAERAQIVGYLSYKYALAYAPFTNTPPTVAIISPTNGTTVAAGANVTLTIAANALADGSYLTRLEVFANSVLLGTSSVSLPSITAPYVVNLATPGSYVLTVRATDNYGFQTTSSAITVTASSFVTPTLAPTNALVVWLKADAGVVTDPGDNVSITSWLDQSGHGNDASQPTVANAPTLRTNILNGLPAARFNVLDTGASRYMTIPSNPSIANFTTNFTFLTVAMEFDQGANYAIISETTGSYFPNPYSWHFVGGGTIGLDLGAGAAPTIANNSGISASGVFGVLAARVGNNTVRQSVNLAQGNTSIIGAAAVADAGGPLNIGQGSGQFTGLYGYMTELMCYSNRLSDGDFVQAQIYLARKYGRTVPAVALPGTGAPSLAVTKGPSSVQISWPLNYTDYVLEGRTNVAGGAWFPIATNPPNNSVTLGTTTPAAQYYRLRQ